jgi:hypothetical protein
MAERGAGFAGLGKDLFELANTIQEQKDSLEFSRNKRKADEIRMASFNSITGDFETDAKTWQKSNEDINKLMTSSKSGRVNVATEKYVNEFTPEWKDAFDKHTLGVMKRNTDAEFELEYKNLLGQGRMTEAYTILNNRLILESISQAEYDSLVARALNDAVIEQMRLAIGKNNPQSAIQLSDKLSENATADQLLDINNLVVAAQKQLETTSPEASKQLTDLMAQKKLTIADVQTRRNLLDDEDYQNWTKIAMNPIDKVGNEIKTAELKSRAIDVWRGTITKTDAEKEIRESLADPNGINDKQYGSIYADLDRETKGFQAQDKHSYSIVATQQILGKDAGAIQFDALGNISIDVTKMLSPESEFRRKLHFVTLYNKEMDDFIAENPKVSKKDLWLKAEELKQTYTEASISGQIQQYPKQKREYKKGDKRTIGGITYTFDGQIWND